MAGLRTLIGSQLFVLLVTAVLSANSLVAEESKKSGGRPVATAAQSKGGQNVDCGSNSYCSSGNVCCSSSGSAPAEKCCDSSMPYWCARTNTCYSSQTTAETECSGWTICYSPSN